MAGWGWIGDLCIQQGRATALDTKKHLVGSVTFFVPDLVQGYLSCVRKRLHGCGCGRVAKWSGRVSFLWPRNENQTPSRIIKNHQESRTRSERICFIYVCFILPCRSMRYITIIIFSVNDLTTIPWPDVVRDIFLWAKIMIVQFIHVATIRNRFSIDASCQHFTA